MWKASLRTGLLISGQAAVASGHALRGGLQLTQGAGGSYTEGRSRSLHEFHHHTFHIYFDVYLNTRADAVFFFPWAYKVGSSSCAPSCGLELVGGSYGQNGQR